MTLLAIDAGNTRIKWGAHDGMGWVAQGAIATADAPTLSAAVGTSDAQLAVVANVAGERVAKAVEEALANVTAERHWVIARAEQCGVRSSYADAAQLGADRWAALIGVRHLFDGPAVVVNAGTTMTVDALSSDGIFLGGCIVPGYELMRQALAAHTAQLSLREGRFSFFPDNTGDAIASGALNALAGAVQRMCRYVTDAGEAEPMVIVSGGNAALLGPHLGERAQVVDNLVLEGLVRIGTDVV